MKGEASLARILVVRLADIGDLLTATPALRALRETYPAARIDLLTTGHAAPAVPTRLFDFLIQAPRQLVKRPRDLARLPALLGRLRAARYDAVLLLHHLTLASGVAKYRLLAMASGSSRVVGLDNGRGGWLHAAVPDLGFGARHEVQYCLDVAALIGTGTSDTRLEAQYDARDMTHAAGLLMGLGQGPWVAIHAGSGGYAPARRWSSDNWATVCDRLAGDLGAQTVLVGTPADGGALVTAKARTDVLDLTGRTTLPQLAAVLSQCNLFVGADSGVMHTACAVGIPVVALFGPTNHLAWGPWTPDGRSRVVRADLPCCPCAYVGHSVGQRDGCPQCDCMAAITPDAVMQAVADLDVLHA